MKTRNNAKRRWKETLVRLTNATALVLDGPGSEWLLVMRGERTRRRSAKGGRS